MQENTVLTKTYNEFTELHQKCTVIRWRLEDFRMKFRMPAKTYLIFSVEVANMMDFLLDSREMFLKSVHFSDEKQECIKEFLLHIDKINELIQLVDQAAEKDSLDDIEGYLSDIADCLRENSTYIDILIG